MPICKEELLTEGLEHPLFLRLWLPDGQARGLVQLCHGMAEHSARYDRLGRFLAENGYAAFCHDHRGHGHSCLPGEPLGYFAPTDGWEVLVRDALTVGTQLRRRFPDGPFFLFGHSMGSLIVSDMAAREHAACYDGFILCGSPAPNAMARTGAAMARGFCKAGMAKKPNHLLHAMAFADVNKLFRREPSKNAWLTSDADHVQKYDRDPLCGFHFTSAGYRDLFTGLARNRNTGWAVRTVCRPFLLIAGQDDPIGNCGKGVLWLRDQLLAAGRDTRCILYPGKRHEILNETDCGQVYDDILNFIREVDPNV